MNEDLNIIYLVNNNQDLFHIHTKEYLKLKKKENNVIKANKTNEYEKGDEDVKKKLIQENNKIKMWWEVIVDAISKLITKSLLIKEGYIIKDFSINNEYYCKNKKGNISNLIRPLLVLFKNHFSGANKIKRKEK